MNNNLKMGAMIGGGVLLGVLLTLALSGISHRGYMGEGMMMDREHYGKHEMYDKMHDMHNDMMDDKTKMTDKKMGMEDMMHTMSTSLEGKSGAELDADFLNEMVVHHEGAVEMAKAVLERGDNAELKAFAQAIIDVQTAEITQMQNWSNAWFPPQVQ